MDALSELRSRLARGEAVVAGVLSGTSADGVDVALARVPVAGDDVEPGGVRCLAFRTAPFPAELGRRLRRVLDGEPCGLRETALLHRDLGIAFGRAARETAEGAGLPLDLVGSHGQTVWHHDGNEPSGPATLQLGDGDHLAAAAGAWVASDFRQADVAAGGEGAPLSALADGVLFAGLERPAAILNLGGMGNLTLLAAGDAPAAAFDTGPANALLDGLARRFLGAEYDDGGACAARGRPDEGLVAELLRHPFFDRPPLRSTGRDTFGEAWVGEVVERARARGLVPGSAGAGEDAAASLLASAVELAAASVALALERFAPAPPRILVLAGGGARNAALRSALERRTGLAARPSDAWGVPADAREALVFAVLAVRAVLGRPSSSPVTGARPGAVLGKLGPPAGPRARRPVASPRAGPE